jgi:hypothetical protein
MQLSFGRTKRQEREALHLSLSSSNLGMRCPVASFPTFVHGTYTDKNTFYLPVNKITVGIQQKTLRHVHETIVAVQKQYYIFLCALL